MSFKKSEFKDAGIFKTDENSAIVFGKFVKRKLEEEHGLVYETVNKIFLDFLNEVELEKVNKQDLYDEFIKDNAGVIDFCLSENQKCKNCLNSIKTCPKLSKGRINNVEFDYDLKSLNIVSRMCHISKTLSKLNSNVKYSYINHIDLYDKAFIFDKKLKKVLSDSAINIFKNEDKLLDGKSSLNYLCIANSDLLDYLWAHLAIKFVENNKTVNLINADEYSDHMLQYKNDNENIEINNELKKCDLLVINKLNDLYLTNTNLLETKFLPLLKSRISNNKSTIIVSYKKLDDVFVSNKQNLVMQNIKEILLNNFVDAHSNKRFY